MGANCINNKNKLAELHTNQYKDKMKRKPHPKVIQRRLGREKADGLYCDNVIEIDPTLPPMRYLIVLIHEYLHHIQPEWSEQKVDAEGEALGRFLWKQGYRKVHQ